MKNEPHSAELLQEWERYFNISIPRKNAERIKTIQQAAQCICDLLNIKEHGQSKKELFARLQQAIINSGLGTRPVKNKELVAYYLPHQATENWQRLSAELALMVPIPQVIKNTTNVRSGFFRTETKVLYDYSLVTFDKLTDIIAAANYKKLAEGNAIRGKQEVYNAVAGIIAEKTGAELYEITKDSSFTKELDID